MSPFIPAHWLYCLIAIISSCIFNPHSIVLANDETEVLQLLVETLNQTDDAKLQESLMRGMVSGLEGRRAVTAPENWKPLSAKLSQHPDPEIRNLALQLSQFFGDTNAYLLAVVIIRYKNILLNAFDYNSMFT